MKDEPKPKRVDLSFHAVPASGEQQSAEEWLYANTNLEPGAPTVVRQVEVVAGWLEAYARSRVEQWVSVKERLPKSEKWVLVYAAKKVRCALLDVVSSDKPFFTDNSDVVERVTHWQPLPAPPAERALRGGGR